MPPDISDTTAKFPALQEDMVVHVYRRRSWDNPTTAISFLQEIWCLESSGRGARRVRRTATLISVDLKTGNQNERRRGVFRRPKP